MDNTRQANIETRLRLEEQTYQVELEYPPYEDEQCTGKVRYVEVDMCSVRATDGVRLSYHFGRNGWVVEQATVFEWLINGKSVCCDNETCTDSHWVEVAFIPSWGSQRIPEPSTES